MMDPALGWHAGLVVLVLLGILVALVKQLTRPEYVMLGGVGILLLAGVLSPLEAFAGFSNPAVLTVGALLVIAAGVERTGAVEFVDGALFPRQPTIKRALFRLSVTSSLLSGFMNNTPVVAILMPRVTRWSNRVGISASKLLIPLSYATIVGGMLTLIGTSTNLVVAGWMVAAGYEPMGLFTITPIALPVVVGVLLYLTFIGHRLLPDRRETNHQYEHGLTGCLFEIRVDETSEMVGQTVARAGLRQLETAYLVHIRREGKILPSAPGEVICKGDVLAFTGSISVMEGLLERPGLEPVVSLGERAEKRALPQFEAVVAGSSELVGKTLKEVRFRDHYHGVVLAIQRKDRNISGGLGRTPLRAGDLLVVEATNGFDKMWNANRETFYLVAARRPHRRPLYRRKAPIARAILVAVVIAAMTGWLPVVTAAFLGALAMIATRCLEGKEAREAVDIQILLVIAAALALGQAVETTGLAAAAAAGLVGASDSVGTLAILIGIYLATMILTEMISNNAAAVLMLPVAMRVAADLSIPPMALAVMIAIAASASFITPIGYQTNLMVMAAGKYRFSDYTKAGIPVGLLVMSISITMIYLRWIA